MREIVSRFQEARPKAIALARQENENATVSEASKKRKVEDTDMEDETPVRSTRSRITRSSSRRGNGMAEAPIEVADSEEEQDGEFIPDEDKVECPICGARMKEEAVWPHINNNCQDGTKTASGRRGQQR